MADKKFTDLASAAALMGDEVVPLTQTGLTKRTTVKDVAKFGYQDILTDATGTKTLALADRGVWLRFTNATASVLTIPTNASVAIGIGESFNGVQGAAGLITFTPAGGVTVNKPSGYNAKTRAQGSAFCLIKIETDVWDLVGDLEATV